MYRNAYNRVARYFTRASEVACSIASCVEYILSACENLIRVSWRKIACTTEARAIGWENAAPIVKNQDEMYIGLVLQLHR
jgi:hypothetical protein